MGQVGIFTERSLPLALPLGKTLSPACLLVDRFTDPVTSSAYSNDLLDGIDGLKSEIQAECFL